MAVMRQANCFADKLPLSFGGARNGEVTFLIAIAAGTQSNCRAARGSRGRSVSRRLALWLWVILFHVGNGEGWRRERDSNPRNLLQFVRFPGVCLKPLGHL